MIAGLNLLTSLPLLVGLLMLLAWVRKAHRNESDGLHASDFLLGEDGRASKSALVLYVSLMVTSWVLVSQAIRGTLTDLNFAAYIAGWVAPTVTRIIAGGHSVRPEPTP